MVSFTVYLGEEVFTFRAQVARVGWKIPSHQENFERFFGAVGVNEFVGSVSDGVHPDAVFPGYTVYKRKHTGSFVIDFIAPSLNYEGMLTYAQTFSADLFRARQDAEFQRERANYFRRLNVSGSVPLNVHYWVRGGLDECAVCFEHTYSRFTCGHSICGNCCSNLRQRGDMKCPVCRVECTGKAGDFGSGDKLAHLLLQRKAVDKENADLKTEIAMLRSTLCDYELSSRPFSSGGLFSGLTTFIRNRLSCTS